MPDLGDLTGKWKTATKEIIDIVPQAIANLQVVFPYKSVDGRYLIDKDGTIYMLVDKIIERKREHTKDF